MCSVDVSPHSMVIRKGLLTGVANVLLVGIATVDLCFHREGDRHS